MSESNGNSNGSNASSNGGLIRQQDSGGGGALSVSVYDRVEPLQFIAEMGKAFNHACIAKTEAEGKVLALACLCERKNVFEIKRTYHLIEGNLSMRSDAMLAKFRQAGGKAEWLKTGDDGIEASLKLQYRDEKPYTISFSIDKAQKAGYVKSGSQWAKRPDQMLRARCITDGVRMVAPEIIAGYYSEDELADVQAAGGGGNGAAAAASVRSAAEVEARRRELQAAASQPQEQIIDAEAVPAVPAGATSTTTPAGIAKHDADAESVPFEVPGERDNTLGANVEYIRESHMLDFQAACELRGTTPAAVLVRVTAANPDITSFDQLSNEQIAKLSANLRAAAVKSREEATASK